MLCVSYKLSISKLCSKMSDCKTYNSAVLVKEVIELCNVPPIRYIAKYMALSFHLIFLIITSVKLLWVLVHF